jgi:hypothetical protein
MDFAHSMVAVLVKRLGGRVEISPDEIDAMGRNGEELVMLQPTTVFRYVLELRQPTAEPVVETHKLERAG